MAAVKVGTDPKLGSPPTPNFSLNRVGSLFVDPSSPSNIDSSYYVLGSIGRLCNEVDDITLAESSSTRTAPSSNSPEMVPIPLQRVPTAYDRDTPVFSWESRTTTQIDDGTSLADMLRKRRNPGSSLAPQSSSDPSDDERSEAPSVGQFRPGTDLIQCPVQGCERTFKWKKNLHHHIRDKHSTDAAGLSVMRIQPAHVGAAHNGFRLQSIAIAPPPHTVAMPPGSDPGLRCPECGKIFSRKGDLVHHKRYHTRSTDRPYKCEQCGQGFIHHKDLARHMPRHTGQRSFQCPFPECHKNYTRKDNLNRHMRHDHGGLGASGEVWTGVDVAPAPMAQPTPMALPIPIPVPQETHYDPPIDPAIPVSSHLTAIAEAASNHALLQESNMQHQSHNYHPMFAESSMQQEPAEHALLQEPTYHEPKLETSSSDVSMNGSMNGHLQTSYRETTPSLGKRPADDLERLATGIKPKRKPKEKWAHRLGCPFRKCRSDMFTTENGYRVCETTPHEFIIRLIEHMKRNHDLYVCGECFLGFKTPDALNSHKSTSHHCGKCYMSFPNEEVFIQHANSCMTVDAATQEDIWQILYETLCADGVRHNPSFDDETPVNSSIQSNNRVRMQLLAEQPLASGQVPSLAKQLGSPLAGNGVAPPVERVDELHHRQQLVPVGASNFSQAASGRAQSPPMSRTEAQLLGENQSQRETIQALQGILAIEQQARLEAEVRADVFASARTHDIVQAAVRRFVSSARRPKPALVKPRYETGWVEEVNELQGEGVDVVALAPPRQQPISPSIEESFATAFMPGEMLLPFVLPAQATIPNALHCPSLTSESTTQSLQEPTAPLAFSLPLGVMYEFGAEDNAQEMAFTWNQPWECQWCGRELEQAGDIVFCKNCNPLNRC